MKLVLALIILLTPTISAAVDCGVHKIYCRIMELQPRANKEMAMEASNTLYVASKYYKYNPMISVAIAMQESSWLPNSYLVKKSRDVGLTQFRPETIFDAGLDEFRIRHDLVYHLWQHARLLKRKVRVCKENGWAKGEEWSCWHIYPTGRNKKETAKREKLRKIYASKVKKHLRASLMGSASIKFKPSNLLAVRTALDEGTGFVIKYGKKSFGITAGHICLRNRFIEARVVKGLTSDKEKDTKSKHKILKSLTQPDICVFEYSEDGFKVSDVQPKLLDRLFYIGYPAGQLSSAEGLVHLVENKDIYVGMTILPGASGAPVFNSSGSVVGIISEYLLLESKDLKKVDAFVVNISHAIDIIKSFKKEKK